MRDDKITVLRNEFSAIIDKIEETMLSDESIINSAIELECKLFDFANSADIN